MTLQPGTRLGNYEVLSDLGRGGMGEVYKARDLKLGREIAIKVLPKDTAADAQRLRRFEQEARAASALNHPNIVTIYEIGEHEGTPYIAMEYVEGKSLREILADGPLPHDKLIRYATQMAEGLAKAHEAGIVHRDLKPENIVISDDGYVKILDFGLAKLLPLEGVRSEVATVEKAATTPGTVLGTLSYMSPEQAKGEIVDHRSDQFGFGAIVYEMVTGNKAFERDTAAETLSAVLRDEPTVIGMPVGIESVVRRCLSKPRELRYASTTEILQEINRTGSEARRPRLRSLAVLPLVNLSADAEQEFFADGMTEALITDLAKIRGLKVISRSSAMRFKGTDKPLTEIASELGVDAVLEGSVLRAGERVRISAQLIDAKADEHLWAHRYEEDLRDVLQLQNEVARAIVAEVDVTLTPQEADRLRTARRVDPVAFEAYLQGRHFWNKRTEAGLRKALVLFREAVDADAVYARAYAGMADVYNLLAILALEPASEAYPMAKAAAKRAIEIDASLGEAHTSLALTSALYDWDWRSAEREFLRAIELSPDYATAHHFYGGYVLCPLGRHEDALAELRHAQDLDPLAPVLRADTACVLLYAGKGAEAIDQCFQTLQRFPDFPIPYFYLIYALVQEDRYDDAVNAGRRAVELSGNDPNFKARLAFALAAAGRGEEAEAVLAELGSDGPAHPIAVTYVRLGKMDEALTSLEKALTGRAWEVLLMNVDARLDPLRSAPRFQDLLRRMNFPE